MLDEDRQEPVRRVDELLIRLLGGVLEQHLLVGHPGAVVDAVVGGEPVADVLEHGPARGARDQPEARDDQPLVEDLHLEDLLLERVRLEGHVRELVQVGVALGGAAGLGDQLQPRLGVARLVLHHRRVVELRLGVGRDVEQLRGHLAGEDVRLELLGEHRAPHVPAPGLPHRRALALRDRRQLAPGQVAHLPLLALGQLVEAQDAGERLALVRLLVDHLLGRHQQELIPPELKLRGRARKWPRKNDPDSIKARQEALGLDGEVTRDRPRALARAQEMLTGVAVIPVSVVGPLELELGEYELREPGGELAETARARDTVFVPLAHTEGGLSASLYRGAKAVAESGGFRTFVLADRITRASCFVFASAAEAVEFSRWLEGELDSIRAWLAEQDDPALSKHARLREVKTHVVGPMCHVLWRWTTGDAVGTNMMTRNAYVLNMGYVMERAPVKPERAILEANMGGDKKPSFEYFQSGHGKTVLAETTLTEDAVRRVLRTGARRPAGARLGGNPRGDRLRDAVGRLHPRLGDRRDLRGHRPGPRHGRHELDGAWNRRGGSRPA